MHEALAPFKSEFVQQDGEHLEVVVLLVANHINHLVDGIVLETELGRTDVLRHINARSVGAEKKLLIETFLREVGPDRTIGATIEDTLLQTFIHLLFTLEVGVAFIINLVEANAKRLIGLVEALIHPGVHLAPKVAHFLVALLPFHEHFVGLNDERRLVLGACLSFLFSNALSDELRLEFLHLFAIVLIESHIIVANQVVALLA